MARTNNLTNFLTDVATAIKAKKGDNTGIPAANFDTEIANIQTGAITDEEYNIDMDLAEDILGISPIVYEGYTRLRYIQTTGTQYIDTGVKYIADFEFTIQVSIDSDTGANLFGGAAGPSGPYPYFSLREDMCNYYVTTTRPTHLSVGAIDYNNVHTYELLRGESDNYYRTYVDGDVVSVDTSNTPASHPVSSTNTNTIALFSYKDTDGTIRSASSEVFKGKFYRLIIYDNKTITHIFTPVQRNLDNVIGIYDEITRTFFTNQGTGNFISGGVL